MDVEKWNPETQRCYKSTTHGAKKIPASVINKEIERFKACCDKLFEDFERRNAVPKQNEFRDLFNRALGNAAIGKTADQKKDPADDFFKTFDLFVKKVGVQNAWTKATHTKFSSIKEHLKSFNPQLSLVSFDDDKMQDFVNYMHLVPLRNTTIGKNIAFVKWFLRWASKNNYYPGRVHETYQAKLKGMEGTKEIIYVGWDELMALKDFNPPAHMPGLERVRDVFCFCCFTGLRFSDVKKLCRSDIRENHISVITQKTTDSLLIDLNDHSRAILDKYKDVQFPNDRALPVISNPKMNEALKTLGKLAELNTPQRIVYFQGNCRYEEVKPKYELLTTHAGRRSFVVNALYLGIAAEVIMKWTGHSDFKSMKPYIAIVDKLKAKEMEKFNVVKVA